MLAISISIKSICFVQPLPFFLYILSYFSLWYLSFPSIPATGEVPLHPPNYFSLFYFMYVLFGYLYLFLYLIRIFQ